MTPNPCVECNRYIKWNKMIETADMMQAEYVATGHYAHVIKLDNGRYTVKTADHAEKAQTYMLYRLTQEQLRRTIMPLGGRPKDEVRSIAEKAGLLVAKKPDSQEICFVTDGKYAEYIEYNSEEEVPGEGNFVDEDGNILGKHKGIIHYTIGQRKGLGIAMGHPVFVKEINAEKNEVIVGTKEFTKNTKLVIGNIVYMAYDKECNEFEAQAKIRSTSPLLDCKVSVNGKDKAVVSFVTPAFSPALGQSVVVYKDDVIVLGGIIKDVN